MAEEYKLSFSADEIDNRLKMAVLFSEQTLTEEQQLQIKRNIGLLNNPDEPSSTGFKYTYDGNNTDLTTKTWLYTASGNPVFVKVGEVPENGLDLVGSEVAVQIPEWSHNNYEFIITSAMLKEQIVVANQTIKAVVDGLTQIFYQDTNSNDYNFNTMVMVCTKPGDYTVAMNGWTENFRISETGIYFVDNRSVWGGKYVESLIWHEPVEDNDDSEIDGNGNEIQMFSRGLCIGDSITEGVFNYDSGQTVIKKYSYPTLLQRITGIDIVNAGIGGLTAETWYNASINSNTQYGKWLNNEWVWNMNPTVGTGDIVSDSLNYSGFDFSVIHLGINDIYLMGDKAIEDVIANFETNIYNIINKLKTANKGIKIFLCTIIPSYAVPGDTNYEAINAKIKEIAEATEEVYLIDLNKYSKCTAGSPYAHIHLTALGYRQMATEIMSLINYTIKNNLENFKTVQFIGTDYTL